MLILFAIGFSSMYGKPENVFAPELTFLTFTVSFYNSISILRYYAASFLAFIDGFVVVLKD